MCGRTACTLAPDEIVRACRYRDRNGRCQRPVWKDPPGDRQYYPSYNIAPASHTPVLLSSEHFPGEYKEKSERVIQPMKWGLVPAWHKGDPYKLEYETNNCRAEGMQTKRTYKVPLEKGHRCVVLADGFFEWKRTKEGKQPYFIYPPHNPEDVKPNIKTESASADAKPDVKPVSVKPDPDLPSSSGIKQEPKTEHIKSDPDQDASVKTENKESVKPDPDAGDSAEQDREEEDSEEWHGKPLMKMAGVFDVWHPPDGSPPLYSYSVITVDSSPAMSWIHNRMPAILTTEEEVQDWLEFSEVPLTKAVKLIHPTEVIQMHMVSPIVNNSCNKSPECVEPYNPKEVKKTPSSNLMMNWLAKGRKSTEPESPDAKKPKLK